MGCEHSNLVHNNLNQEEKSNPDAKCGPIKQALPEQSPLKPLSKQLSGREIILISGIIEKHILFYKLRLEQRMKLISSMEKFSVVHDTYIFKQNDEPNYAFIVEEGTVRIELQREGRQIRKILREGSVFGDLALINVSKRTASAYAETDCHLIALSKENFQKKMEELARDSHHLLFNYIDCAPVFKKLTLFQKRSLAAHMHEVKFEKDAIIFQVGDFANCIYLIKSGEIEVTVPNRSPVVLKSGDIFGEGSLKTHSIRRGEAKALTIANCFVISRNKLSLCVQASDIDDITYHCIIRWSLKRTSKFAGVSAEKIQKIIENGQISEVVDGTVIATAGQQLSKLMICLEGELYLEDIFRTLKQDEELLGVGCVINEDYDVPFNSPYTITKKTTGHFFTIEHRILNHLFNPTPLRLSLSLRSTTEPDVDLKDYQLLKKLQAPLLTNKYLVAEKRSKINYIIHAYNKYEAIEYKKQKLLANDKELNQSLNNRFVINLIRTFKDKSYIYFVYREYLNFTLDSLMQKPTLPLSQTVDFIVMNLINLLEYLHKEHILFRDLKPENIYLQKNGYPHIISFMLAKKISKIDFKTYTIIGTPHYLAPEVQIGLGYSFPADYWALGVIIYQLAVGNLPFASDKEDPYDVFLQVQKQKLTFPKSFTDKRMKKLIKLLLSKDSWNRPDHISIKACSYFKDFTVQHWQQLENASLKPPEEIASEINQYVSSQEQSIHESQGSLHLFLEKQRVRRGHRTSLTFDSGWDECF